jgi:murein L,D-transpeptidase YafK
MIKRHTRKMMKTLTLLITIIFFTPALASEKIELIIDRSEHKLIIKKEGVTLRTYKVALGSGGRKAKLQEGDHKTPKGLYRIRKVRDSERFHMFMQLDYPNMDDAKRALNNHIITRQQYRAILEAHSYNRLPPQNTALGGAIGIHGIGFETKDKLEIHDIADWTQGCIALRNSEIEELSRYIHIGTTVSIID